MAPVEQLRQIRDKLELSVRDVESLSREIAASEEDSEFSISHAYLSQVENGDTRLTSFHKVFSLASIYGMSVTELLLVMGVDSQKVVLYHDQMPIPKTHLTDYRTLEESGPIEFPRGFDTTWNQNETRLLSRIVKTWGIVPVALLRRLGARPYLYAYIGLKDYTLYPLIKPGTFLQIDPEIKKIKRVKKVKEVRSQTDRSEYDRPIYFLDLGTEYACGWCKLDGDKLILVPHPHSPCEIRSFAYPEEANILGQVIGVAMRIVSPRDETIPENSKSSE